MVAVLSDTGRAISLEEMPPLVVIGEERRRRWRKGPLAVLGLIVAGVGLVAVPSGESSEPAILQVQMGDEGATGIGMDGTSAIASERFTVTAGVIPDVTLGTLDGSDGVQALLRLDGAEAPTEYRFEGAIPEGATGEILADGSVDLLGPGGEQIGIIAAPWAFDAEGNSVATSYAIEGDVLVQTIDHLDQAVYPVVADPWYKPWTWSKKNKKFGKWAVVCLATIGMASPTVIGAVGSAAICIVTYP